ncbi:DoxX family protein [Novosphingobium sp. AP12]|uniref:DoxX family protein n=1 Tax=Novosphingobium sp. AP12 TaxID=1144305 RepID=UPI000271ED21|nr:DoxX family protein [Novosphingobium sp. AP12]EJL21503.1 putative membrane protein [Novosphingobium sp. AP12]
MTTIVDTLSPAATRKSATSTLERSLPVIGRVLIAAIFLLSGASKIADPAGSIAYITSVGLPLPALALVGAIVVEIVGGLLLISGYRVRTVAAVLAAFSLATAVFFHSALGDQNQFIHFFKNVAMAGGLLQIVAFGKSRA